MRGYRHCHTPVLENHRDDEAPNGKIRCVFIVFCCHWTSSVAQSSNNFEGCDLQRPTVPLCRDEGFMCETRVEDGHIRASHIYGNSRYLLPV